VRHQRAVDSEQVAGDQVALYGFLQLTASLGKAVSSQDGSSRLEDLIVDETLYDVPDAVIEAIEVAWLREAIGRLPQKARYVLVRR